jgi:hypothetical protein
VSFDRAGGEADRRELASPGATTVDYDGSGITGAGGADTRDPAVIEQDFFYSASGNDIDRTVLAGFESGIDEGFGIDRALLKKIAVQVCGSERRLELGD